MFYNDDSQNVNLLIRYTVRQQPESQRNRNSITSRQQVSKDVTLKLQPFQQFEQPVLLTRLMESVYLPTTCWAYTL